MSELCPCGSTNKVNDCCVLYIKGGENAPNAEALMRSRYTAYTMMEIDYIMKTHDPSGRDQIDEEGIKKWAKQAQWNGLEIINVDASEKKNKVSVVEFKVHYTLNSQAQELHEVSRFVLKNKQWFYVDGYTPGQKQYTRELPKIGRNDPCHCGSGKKYKKCCA